MEQEIIKAAFVKNYDTHKQQLLERYKVMELSRLGRDVQRQQFKDIENRVLAQHEFFAKQECRERFGIKPGDRITDAEYSFLLSKDDFNRLQELMLPVWVEEGLTDKSGRFIKNWDMIAIEAEREFAFYIIDNLVPAEYQHRLREGIKYSITLRDKLINIFAKALKD
jgi:hypothetical protein